MSRPSNQSARVLWLKQAEIRREISLQTRVGIDMATVEEYKEALLSGAEFPPIVVFFDKLYYYLADGWHRYEAYAAARIDGIPATVYEGSRRDAQLYALGANASHGLRRTNEDKRRAVELMLEDDEWRQWSAREIARVCRVSHDLVARVRASLSSNDSHGSVVYKTKHGAQAVMKTANIGRNQGSSGGIPHSDSKAAESVSAPASHGAAEPELESAAELAARTDAVARKPVHTAEPDGLIDELREQVATLADELEEVRGELDAYRAAESGQGEAKLIEASKEIARLKGEIRRLQDRRDDLMNENAELKREVKRLRKQLGYKANG